MKNKLPLTKLIRQACLQVGFSKKTQEKRNLTHVKLFLGSFLLLATWQANAQLATENFETGIPSDWTLAENNEATLSWTATTDGYEGSNAVSVNPAADNIGDQNTAEYYLITPLVTVPENGQIRFYTKQGNEADNGTTYEVRLSTASQPDINGFATTLQTWTETTLNEGSQTAYEEKVIQIPSGIAAGLNVYIAFVAINTQNGATPTGDAWFIDNARVVEACAEVAEADVTVDNITPESATINWTHPEASNFEIQVVPQGDAIADLGTEVTGYSYSANNLEGDTAYDVYIKTNCGNDTSSQWAGPFAFTTATLGLSCDYPIVVPDVLSGATYTLEDNLSNYSNPDITYTTQGSGCLSQTTNYLNGDKIFFSYTASETGLITLSQSSPGYVSGTTENCYNSNTAVLIYNSCSDVGVNCLAALTTSSGNLENQISNFYVEAGETYIMVMSSDLSPGAGICFTFEVTGSSCAAPSDITYQNLTQTGAQFSWDNPGDLADSWEYAVVPTGEGEPTTGITPASTNIDNPVTGLSAGTTYDFYVRSTCESTTGEWGQPYTFTTQCSVFSTPYTEDFTGATNTAPADCWYNIDANEDGAGWEYLQSAATIYYYDASEYDDYFISPSIDLSGNQKRLKFKYQAMGGDVQFEVLASTDGVGSTNFSTVVMPETTFTETEYGVFVEKIIVLPTSMNQVTNFAWHVITDSNATRVYIDDVVVEDLPACSNPIAPTVNGVTTTTAELEWTQGYEETQWEVIVQDMNAGAPATDASGTITGDNPYTVENLDPAHQYEYYVRAYCNEDDQSEWVGPTTFITECATFDTPFYESFDDTDPETKKFCWTINNVNADDAQWAINANETSIQPVGFFVQTSEYDDWLISPAINVDGVKQLKYDYRAAFSFFAPTPRFGVEVLMSTTDTDPSSFTVIDPYFDFTNTDYQERSVYIEATGTIYIAFRVPPEFDTTEGQSVLNIDNVEIIDAPNCPDPSGITVGTVTQNTAEITWDTGFQEDQWNIVVQPAGTGEPTGTGDEVNDVSQYVAIDLDPATTYEVYVQANCSDEDQSNWVGPVTFTTLCAAFDTPFVETFEADSESEDCWRIIDGNENDHTWNMESMIYPYEGNESAGMFTGTNGDNDDWLISPTITVTANQRLVYYYRVNDSFFAEDLEVLLSTNGIGLDNFTTVLYNSDDDTVLINNDYYKVKVINLPAGIAGDINIAFHIPEKPALSQGYRGQSLFIDNVTIEDIPECPQPSNITITNISDTHINVGWDANGSEGNWQIAVVPYDEEATIDNIPTEYIYDADSNPFIVDGLTPSTLYDVFVRAVCDDDTQSGWIQAGDQVLTKCDLDNLCQYTIILTSDSSLSTSIDVIQNDELVQSLPFNGGNTPEQFTIYLCSGSQFSLYFSTLGTVASQYENYQIQVLDSDNVEVFNTTGPAPKTTIYSGVSLCGEVSCPQPTNLTVSPEMELSWTPGGEESQWEVAIQPIENGSLPQSGTIVNTNTYTPVHTDFINPNAATYEYFVRAVCGGDDSSYWSGPYQFVRNDDATTALNLPINTNEDCTVNATEVSFINATVSDEAISCSGTNQADVWFNFVANSRVHIIQANGFTGNFYVSSGEEPYPEITMTLYHVLSDGTLQEMKCSQNNSIVASYTSELVVGDTYKVRLVLNDPITNTRRFKMCVTTPEDLCSINAVNYDFEEPVLSTFSGITTISTPRVVPGWTQDMETDQGNEIFIWESLNAPNFNSYSGSQCIQLISDDASLYDEADIRGLYKDFDSSEITDFDYSFAHQARADGNTIQLYAGPPGGPYTLVTEQVGNVAVWNLHTGTYEVPTGQDVTRFIFRSKDYAIGNLLDAANFTANTEILTQPQTIDCENASVAVEANGVGTWSADEANPGQVSIDNENSASTTISNFMVPGDYTFYWKTRYCENEITFTYEGIDEVPEVDSPIDYCQTDTAEPLTASSLEGYSLVWYTESIGGTALTAAPTPSTDQVGSTTYYVAYADPNGCEGARAEITVNINELTTPVVEFSYDDTCLNASVNPMPIVAVDFNEGGTFSSTTLTVDDATGEVDLSTATPGTHEVIYTLAKDTENCIAAATFTAEIILTEGITPVTSFTYGAATYYHGSENEMPEIPADFTATGTFSAANGLVIDSITGEINFAASESGTYTITYQVDADETICQVAKSSTYELTIVDNPQVEIEENCINGEIVLEAIISNQSSADFDFIWYDATGEVVGDNEEQFNVTQYAAAHEGVRVPISFTVSIAMGDCVNEASYEVQVTSCADIPRGISPNGDGKNDQLDLTGYDVEYISIFNRYGREVFSKKNYTNQWHGQTNDNKELPDGTYFYNLKKADGSTLTGWIYINKQH